MSISSTTSSSNAMQQQMMQPIRQPSATDMATKVIETSDINADSLLNIDELGVSEEKFKELDNNSDGNISSDELVETISSKLDDMKNQTLTPASFASFLTSLGLDVPDAPSGNTSLDANKMATDIFASKDIDQDGVMSIDELEVSKELFTSLDSDEDGSITQEELEDGLASLFSSVESGEKTKEEVGNVLTELGVSPAEEGKPTGQGGGPSGGGGSSDEEYDEADANQDGVVSAAEQAAYDASVNNETQDYALQLVGSLIDALKNENDNSSDAMDLSKFKSIMSMVNNETQEAATADKLNTYVSNLD